MAVRPRFFYIVRCQPVNRNLERKPSVLINQAWQPLGQTRHAQIYPYLRKPDLLSSNSCLIRTPEQIILIDAGALAAQSADLLRVIRECVEERSRPVVIYLTHCHVDHSLQLRSMRQLLTSTSVWIAVQEEGAGFLIEGDARNTIAELYGMPFPSIQPDIRLLTGQDRKRAMPRRIRLAPETMLNLWMENVPADGGMAHVRQMVSIGGGDTMEFYPACGHSPDSICIRAGEVLFIGDLLAAANPMVAGISGWRREDLIDTLRHVRWLLDNMPIRYCYPGHGAVIPADKAREVLKKLERKASKLGDVTRMNEQRLFQIVDYALELIDEAEEVFSAIAGRLLYVAYQLEQLEEEEAARRCKTVMAMDQIDACLMDFRNLCRLRDDGKIRQVEFAHGALHLVEKIRLLFDPGPLGAILPRSMINRGTSLLLDFIGIASGCRNLEEFIPADINELMSGVVRAWQASPHQDATIIEDADDYDRYLAALVLRIGHEPAGSRPVVSFTPDGNLPFARVAAGRFSDTLTNFLEWIGQAHPPAISMTAYPEGEGIRITIKPGGRDVLSATPREEKKINSFRRRFRMCGLILQPERDGFRLTVLEEQAGPPAG